MGANFDSTTPAWIPCTPGARRRTTWSALSREDSHAPPCSYMMTTRMGGTGCRRSMRCTG
eukprot:2755206-Prymnesium_polylepis.1